MKMYEQAAGESLGILRGFFCFKNIRTHKKAVNIHGLFMCEEEIYDNVLSGI